MKTTHKFQIEKYIQIQTVVKRGKKNTGWAFSRKRFCFLTGASKTLILCLTLPP